MRAQGVRRTMLLAGLMAVAILLSTAMTHCQQSVTGSVDTLPVPEFEPPSGIPEAIGFFASLILPKVLADITQLKQYIQSTEFATFRRRYGDVQAVDAVFDRAMRLSWNNVYEALFISMFATMDHRRVGIRLPLLGPLLWFPLSSEFEDEFRARLGALPRRLYPDTPESAAGDRDKLQHFFGAAFLTYTFESGDSADRLGRFIEWGEQEFVVGGTPDDRDVRANNQGEQFALHLLHDKSLHPSLFMQLRSAQEGQ